MKKQIQAPELEIESLILDLRGHKIILDADLATIYRVPTKALNQAVKRNSSRFPEDFRFRLRAMETEDLNRSQIVTGSQRHRDPRFRPYAFTEHGRPCPNGIHANLIEQREIGFFRQPAERFCPTMAGTPQSNSRYYNRPTPSRC